MSGDISTWFRNIPTISRCWFGLSVVFPLAGRIGLLNARHLILSYEHFIHHFQIWRPITALFYFPISPGTGFHYLINLYFLYNYSVRLETGIFDGRPADYLFMLIFNWLCLVIVGLMSDLYLLMDPMVLSVLYVWCQLNKEVIVNFWFGTQFKAMYLPWVLLAFNMILSGGGWTELLGILVGHLYFFLAFKYPQDFGGASFLTTPQFLYNFLPSRHGGVSGFGVPPTSQRRNDDNDGGGGIHRWGRGQALGN